MINEQIHAVITELKTAYMALPWYQRWFFSGWIASKLNDYPAENNQVTNEQVFEVFEAVNNTWFLQRWLFSSINIFYRNNYSIDLRSITGRFTRENAQSQFNALVASKYTGDVADALASARSIGSAAQPSFISLIDSLQKEVCGYLTLQDKSKLASASREYNRLFRNDLMTAKMLMLVARGQQTQAQNLLRHGANLLLQRGDVTDYSGRMFTNITAYEYAYWAKDWHMCRMLEAHMNEETKALTLASCGKMERDGLTYKQQRGDEVVEIIDSKHFDFTPLKEAYANYIQISNRWLDNDATDADLNAAFFAIGVMQRDVPAYVAQEYCRIDRSFDPTPAFDEQHLPRTLTFYNKKNMRNENWFPIVISGVSGLGVDFILIRQQYFHPKTRGAAITCYTHDVGMNYVEREVLSIKDYVERNLAAVTSLDKASTVEIMRSCENLHPLARGLGGLGL